MNFEKETFEQGENNLERNGKINLTEEEFLYLNKESMEGFQKHPAFEGVEIKSLDINKIPADIQKKIDDAGGKTSSFVAIKIAKEVPLHQHTIDGEIYFGGGDGSVLLLDDSKNEIGKFNLSDSNFTTTTIGEWHGVTSTSEKGSTFFGAKFTI